MKNFLLSVCALCMIAGLFVLIDIAEETPEEYQQRLAMEEQEQFMKFYTDQAKEEISRMSDKMRENQGD